MQFKDRTIYNIKLDFVTLNNTNLCDSYIPTPYPIATTPITNPPLLQPPTPKKRRLIMGPRDDLDGKRKSAVNQDQ